MNKSTGLITLRVRLLSLVCCIAWSTIPSGAYAAEYSEDWDAPVVRSLVFTADAIALEVAKDFSSHGSVDGIQYMVADRESLSFVEVSQQVFLALTGGEQTAASSQENKKSEAALSPTDDCQEQGYRYDQGSGPKGRRLLQLPMKTIVVEMDCGSSVSSMTSVDDSVWIGTEYVGDHGVYGAEGVLVVPKNGDPVVRLDIGSPLVYRLLVDSWSGEVWVLTHAQLFRVSGDTTVLARYALHRDFDGQRPVVKVTNSRTPIGNNPLAVLADWMGPTSYAVLSKASRDGVTLSGSEPLYNFSMFGKPATHRPQWPEALAAALEHASPTFGWRKFACLVPGEQAEQLCTTELGRWPRDVDNYLRILQREYPDFVVTGPDHGPRDNQDLRSNRHSPENFEKDVLFADFDYNGVLDFAAVLVENENDIDRRTDEEAIGFVALCRGTWPASGGIDFSCTDITDREPGGFRKELDYVDWEPYAETLLTLNPVSGDARWCRYYLQPNQFNEQTKKGTRKLSIMSSHGPCDQFFYHQDRQFRSCCYCSD